LRELIGKAEVVRVRLDPTDREIHALLENLHNHTLVKTSTLLRETGEENAHHQGII
jgi:hypothetical protein